MRLDALREVVRTGGAEERSSALASLAGETASALYGALVAIVLLDPSLRVRQEAEAALRRRAPDDQADRPAPHAATDRERSDVVAALLEDRGLLELLLVMPRGRDLVAALPMDQVPVDDRLLRLCLETDAAVIQDVLALPLDVSGRAATLLAALPDLAPAARGAIVEAVAWAALHGGTATVPEKEVARAKTLVRLWVEGVIESRGDPTREPPSLEAFAAAGAFVARGPITLSPAEAPRTETVAILADLSQAVLLELVPRVAVDAAPLRALTTSPDAELRTTGWRALHRSQLATPAELLAAAQADRAPGVTVELLRALLPTPIPPAEAPRVVALLGHRVASVRRAAVELLARNPLVAALAAASLDPRAPDASLTLLAALPDALRGPSLAAWLEVDRPAADMARALGLLARPPSPLWLRWGALLASGAAVVRRAARDALLRLPPEEGPGVAPLLEARRLDDPLGWVRGVERFGLADQQARLAHLALDETADKGALAAAVRVLGGYARRGAPDCARSAWTTLAALVLGGSDPAREGRRRRFGDRLVRQAALDQLLAAPDPPDPPAAGGEKEPVLAGRVDAATRALLDQPARLAWPDLVLALLGERDPWQVQLGLRAVHRVQSRAVATRVAPRVAELLAEVLSDARRSRRSRGRRAWLSRVARLLLPAGWVGVGPMARGRPLPLLAALLDAAARLGRAGLWADSARPLLGHADAAVRRAAARLYPSLPGARPLSEVLVWVGPDAALEAVRAASLPQVEGVVLERLARVLDGTPQGPQDPGAWLEARPEVAARPAVSAALARLLAAPRGRALATRGLVALRRSGPEGRATARAALAADAAAALAGREDGPLREALALAAALEEPGLAATLLPAIAWAGEAARQELVAFVRGALEPPDPSAAGVALSRDALAPLLAHPLGEVRTLGLSLLRKGDPQGLFAAVRSAGPCPGRQLPVEQAKPFLGACEDAWEDACGLAVEGLLVHDDGEVARRALKLLNRREREVSTTALLERVAEPELRQPVLTTFSTWAAAALEPQLAGLAGAPRAERLEALRRELRAALELLATGARGAVGAALDDALASPVGPLRAAALRAIGRVGLAGRAPDLVAALAGSDAAQARAAALAAGDLLAARAAPEQRDALLAGLRRAAGAREAELRSSARAALVRVLDPGAAAEVEGLLVDPAPEVVLVGLAAALERPELLARLALEARLGDPDPRVREVALRGLARRGPAGPSGGDALAQALRGPLVDPRPEVRLAALEVVRAWGLADRLRHELASGLVDPSIHVSGATLDALEAVAGAPVEPLEPEPEPEPDEEEPPAEEAPAPSTGDAPTEQFAMPDLGYGEPDPERGYGEEVDDGDDGAKP